MKPEKEVNEKISKGNELPIETSDLYKEINLLFQPNLKFGNAQNFNNLIAESIRNKKFSFFYLYDGFINPGFRLITHKKFFLNYFDFIAIDNPPDNIKKQLQCNYLPAISVIVPDETRKEKNGKAEVQVLVY